MSDIVWEKRSNGRAYLYLKNNLCFARGDTLLIAKRHWQRVAASAALISSPRSGGIWRNLGCPCTCTGFQVDEYDTMLRVSSSQSLSWDILCPYKILIGQCHTTWPGWVRITTDHRQGGMTCTNKDGSSWNRSNLVNGLRTSTYRAQISHVIDLNTWDDECPGRPCDHWRNNQYWRNHEMNNSKISMGVYQRV